MGLVEGFMLLICCANATGEIRLAITKMITRNEDRRISKLK
jgi:hypothetical protein